VPSYCLHRASGQAVVRIDGRDHYLGKHGTPESEERYRRLIARYLTTGGVEEPKANTVDGPTVNELVAAFWTHLERTGRYMKEGRETSERGWFRDALRPLCATFGSLPAAEFGPRRLVELRTWMVEHGGRGGTRLSRTTVNGRVRRIVQVFRWGASMEIVPTAAWHGLQAVRGLRRGESSKLRETGRVQPVAREDVEATLPHLSSQVAAMVQLQWLAGMRPAEVCNMRMAEVDMSGDVWVYRPAHHKTEHREQNCERFLGPKAQEVLRPFLKADAQGFLFSPQEAERARNDERRAARTLPLWPSHEARRKDGCAPHLSESYSVRSYRQAIQRACALAGVESWSPNRLRHARATEVRKQFGLEAAQVVLGHATADVTQVYAERDRELALRVARQTG
jgi:integrase